MEAPVPASPVALRAPRSVRDRSAAPRTCDYSFLSFLRPNLVVNRRRRKTPTARTRLTPHHHSPTNVHRRGVLTPVPRRPAAGQKAARTLDREGLEVRIGGFSTLGAPRGAKKGRAPALGLPHRPPPGLGASTAAEARRCTPAQRAAWRPGGSPRAPQKPLGYPGSTPNTWGYPRYPWGTPGVGPVTSWGNDKVSPPPLVAVRVIQRQEEQQKEGGRVPEVGVSFHKTSPRLTQGRAGPRRTRPSPFVCSPSQRSWKSKRPLVRR